MLDTITILLTPALVVLVVFRAIQLDARNRWFIPRAKGASRPQKGADLAEWD